MNSVQIFLANIFVFTDCMAFEVPPFKRGSDGDARRFRRHLAEERFPAFGGVFGHYT